MGVIRLIYRFEYDVDRARLLEECKNATYHKFKDPKSRYILQCLDICSVERRDPSYARDISDYFRKLLDLPDDDGQPIFYIQNKNDTFPFHIDTNTQCSINILLDDDCTSDPITFRVEEHEDNLVKIESDIDEYYETALINVQCKHGIIDPEYQRHLYKCSIKSKTFDECLDIIRNEHG